MKVKTAQEMEEERLRTLYIRLPHTIKNIDEIRDIIFGDANIKLPRQSGRYCHVIFPTVEEKLKNMKALKKKLLDNKRIFVKTLKMKAPAATIRQKKIRVRKVPSIKIPEPEPEEHVTKTCFIHNIPKSATVKDLKPLFPGAKNVAILYKQRIGDGPRNGIVKFRDVKTARAFLTKETPWPVCKGAQLEIHRDTRKPKKGRKSKPAESPDEIKLESKKSKTVKKEAEDEDNKSESENEDEDDEDEVDDEEDEEEEEDEEDEETED